jgi:hypothetical protein
MERGSRAKFFFFGDGLSVCWSVFFFVVVIFCGMAFVRWRLACFVCVCVSVCVCGCLLKSVNYVN